jgi:hypothetical protein
MLATPPLLVLLLVIGLSVADGEVGVPALAGAGVAAALGPLCYAVARRRRARASTPPR